MKDRLFKEESKMKRLMQWLCLLLALAMLPVGAMADQLYILDTDARPITEAELWQWDRESLSFMFNEIFARHGMQFQPGGKYCTWFNSQPWYQAVAKVDEQTAYDLTTDLEWENYHTIKKVIADMEASGHPYRRPAGSTLKSWLDLTAPGSWSLSGFQYVSFNVNTELPVYSAPSASSWRGANGRAMVSTVGAVWAAGWEKGWLLVYYEIANGVRVGYVDGSQLPVKPLAGVELAFAYTPTTLQADCVITDDPLSQSGIIATLKAGQAVTYLTTAVNQHGQVWDYVETTVGGQTVRGYIRSGFVAIPAEPLPDVDAFAANPGSL